MRVGEITAIDLWWLGREGVEVDWPIHRGRVRTDGSVRERRAYC